MNNYQRGRTLLEQHNVAAARECFQAGADGGDPKCTYGLLAVAAMTNTVTDTLLTKMASALASLQKLAREGDGDACFILGRCAETGSAMPRDILTAVAFYTRAASLGNMDAMFNLGCFYMSQGPEGERLALDCFRKAADGGCVEAQAALAHFLAEGN